MNILIIDDDTNKIKDIVKTISETKKKVNVDTREDIVSAVEALTKTQYHIIIVDMQLPVRKGSSLKSDGGKHLVTEIYRKKKCILPYLIIGLTQYDELKGNFPVLWKIVTYSGTSNWRIMIHSAVDHVNRLLSQPSILKKVNIPTVFVEGESDKLLLELAFKLFSPEFLDKINIEFQKSGGASWVKNQIVAWAFTNNKFENGNPIMAVGLFDNDKAGLYAINETRKLLENESAAKKTFKIVKLSTKYSLVARSMYQKGIKVPITLEEILSPKIWTHGHQNGLLVRRNNLEEYLKDPKGWDKMNQSLSDYLENCKLDTVEILYLSKFSISGKIKVTKFIIDANEKDQSDYLSRFKDLIDDIIVLLKI